MGVDGPSKNLAFDIAAERDVVFGALRMGDTHRVLLDDRAFVQVCRHVMRRRADQLYAALVGLLVGIGTLEARQDGVVDRRSEERRVGKECVCTCRSRWAMYQ